MTKFRKGQIVRYKGRRARVLEVSADFVILQRRLRDYSTLPEDVPYSKPFYVNEHAHHNELVPSSSKYIKIMMLILFVIAVVLYQIK